MPTPRVNGVHTAAVNARQDTKVIDTLCKTTHAVLQKLDKNKDGKIDRSELKVFMTRLEQATRKLDQAVQGATGTSTDEAGLKKAIAASRKMLTDATRHDMAIAQAAGTVDDGGADTVAVSVLDAAVRKVWQGHLNALAHPAGGLIGNLTWIFAAILVPDAGLEASAG